MPFNLDASQVFAAAPFFICFILIVAYCIHNWRYNKRVEKHLQEEKKQLWIAWIEKEEVW